MAVTRHTSSPRQECETEIFLARLDEQAFAFVNSIQTFYNISMYIVQYVKCIDLKEQ